MTPNKRKRYLHAVIVTIFLLLIFGYTSNAALKYNTYAAIMHADFSRVAGIEKEQRESSQNDCEVSDETEAVDESQRSTEYVTESSEYSEEALKAAAVYDFYRDFGSDTDLPFADEETLELLKAAYADVSYFESYEKGDEKLYDAYKEKFYHLINNEVTFVDRTTGEEFYIKDYRWFRDRVDWSSDDYIFYFFDMDGDDEPELCIKNNLAACQYIFDYDAKQEQYTLWGYPLEGVYFELDGTRKIWLYIWGHAFYIEYKFYQLDEKGEVEYSTFFFECPGPETLYIVMYPEYKEKSEKNELPDEAKKQGIFETCTGNWYFRVTEEQYEEFENEYSSANQESEKAREEVTYTYEELFGE